MSEHRTESFILIQPREGDPMEVWVDWLPAVDDAPGCAVSATLDGADLLVSVPSSQLDTAVPRRLVNLEAQARDELREHGGVWVLCGPSGMLGRVPFRLS